jgi:hypothetical protein
MEIAPDLQFMHYSAAEIGLPVDAFVSLGDRLGEIDVCCDLDHNVFNAEHTDPAVVEALRKTHWFDLAEWSTTGPGTAR